MCKPSAVITLLVLLSFIEASHAQLQEQSSYRFQHFTSKDGLADDFVWSIAQDSLGYMWFQNYNSMTRFDGYNFKVYKHNQDHPNTSGLDFPLGKLNNDRNGNVWITKHGHPSEPPYIVARYDSESDTFAKLSANLGDVVISYPSFDDDSTLWLSALFGKGVFMVNKKTGKTSNYVNQNGDEDDYQMENSIFGMKDLGGSLLLATVKGLWSFDKQSKTFSRPSCNPKDSAYLYNTWFAFIIDRANSLWLLESSFQFNGRPVGLVKLRADLTVTYRKPFPENFNISSIDIDSDGVAWIGTWSEGLYRLDTSDDSFINIKNDPLDPSSLKTNSINHIAVDRDQNVWVGSSKGVSKLYRKTIKASNVGSTNFSFRPAGGPGGLVRIKDKEFLLLTHATAKGPLNVFKTFMIEVNSLEDANWKVDEIPGTIGTVAINQFLQGRNKLWVLTYPSGLFYYSIDPATGKLKQEPPIHLEPNDDTPNAIRSNGISAIWEDADENLWVGGTGLHRVNPFIPYGKEGSVLTYRHNDKDTSSISGETILQIYPHNESSFWLVTNAGLDLFHPEKGTFDHIVNANEFVRCIHRAADGTFIAGTTKGIYALNKIGDRYSVEGRPLWTGSEVRAIQEDELGRIWLRTGIGLVCYDRKLNAGVEFGEEDGVANAKAFALGLFHKGSNGTMYMFDSGLTTFNPLSVSINQDNTHTILTKLEVNNKEPMISREAKQSDFSIPTNISVLDQLTIDHGHNNIRIEFSAMQMVFPERSVYRYKLEGYDDEWIETNYKNRIATYTNLNPGDYVFKVKATNNHGIWSDDETKLAITVLPPPWKTTWAYIGYGILFIGLLYAARKNIVQRERLKSNLKLAKVEQEKEHFELEKAKEIDKMKSTFFANISHEFRTPLTLIKGPVQEMMEDFADHPKVKERMRLVERNADLVLKLINQLLDLAKLESGTLKVQKSMNDLNSLISVIIGSFSSLAYQKNIAITSEVPSKRYLVRFDKDKVETILINLINNAIKFTQDGNIHVSASLDDKTKLILSVKDTGIGIPVDQQEKIFERFHQVSDAHKEVGTGIGLSLVKELVALMGGSISLTSEIGKGSLFTIVLPIEQARELTEQDSLQTVGMISNGKDEVLEESTDNGQDHLPHVLVVEDNADLRKFIIDSLGKEFYFLEAPDGKVGMEKAFEFVPDLILSDVMMPEMDGITMTKKLKSDTRTSHIPLILLTAKTSDESKLSGLGTGADDYLTKPFNKNELLLKIRNRIALQTKIREKIKLELLKESPKVEVQSADEKFLLKVKESILSRLSDEQLSVESLAEEIGLSRSQLLRKITALTGVSVNELIRTFRLQKAAQLLEQNWAPVTQVAYEVGYSNLSYFSKMFKEQYGVLPSEYAARVQK